MSASAASGSQRHGGQPWRDTASKCAVRQGDLDEAFAQAWGRLSKMPARGAAATQRGRIGGKRNVRVLDNQPLRYVSDDQLIARWYAHLVVTDAYLSRGTACAALARRLRMASTWVMVPGRGVQWVSHVSRPGTVRA